MACLKFLSDYPCPRCLIPKDWISQLGSKLDMLRREKHARIDSAPCRGKIELVRKWIYERGYSLGSIFIKRLLELGSFTPSRVRFLSQSLAGFSHNLSQNAFSERLQELGFNFYSMFVPDLMHEFELGVWKATFTHLLHILYAHGGDVIQELNYR
jgi:hypothetical protein